MLAPTERRLRRRLPKSQLLLLLGVIGPGIIAANADNDAGGIYAYSAAGAQFGYGLLWVLVLVTLSLAVCQEMGARMGAITGKGLADLIREEYGVKITLFAMGTLLIANFATTVSEFAGITAAFEIFTPAWVRWIVVPASAALIWVLGTRGSYRRVERILLGASLIYLAYIASAILAHPAWPDVFRQTLRPHALHVNGLYISTVIALIGTTITPWGQFFIQSTVRDKPVRADQYPATRIDVLFGAFFTNFIAFFIIVCCGATLFGRADVDTSQISTLGQALVPAAGRLAGLLFAIGLFNASCFGAITVPISTAYAITESLGTESGLGRRGQQSALFIGVFTFLLAVSAVTVLLLPRSLAFLINLPNIVGGVLLPIILVLSLLLVNNRRLMGEHTNSRTYNAIAAVTTAVLIGLSITLLVQALRGGG